MESLHPSVIIGVLALGALYLGALRVSGHTVRPGQAAAFAAALVVILFALCGPIDELEDDRLFAAHMAQHLLLCLVMPPLFVMGLADWMVRPLLLARAVRPLARIFLSPLGAFLMFNAVLIALHAPAVFDWICRNETAHIISHLALMAAGVLLWWPLLSPLPEMPRLSYPAQMLYLFVELIPMAAVAAPISLASGILYPWYSEAAHPFGLAPLADQVAGGLLMWVGAGFYVICVATLIFYQWAQREDRDQPVVLASFQLRISKPR